MRRPLPCRTPFPALPALPALPAPPAAAERQLLDELHRGEPAHRVAIHAESERTIDDHAYLPEPVAAQAQALAGTDAEAIGVGSRLTVMRRVVVDSAEREAEEAFEIEEKLSTERNNSGDVYRARRYWNGTSCGDVVLKTPKSELRRTLPARQLEEASASELRHLARFAAHPVMLAAAGRPFRWRAGLVIQVKYQPWSLSEYLACFSDEELLTAAVARAACQCVSAVAFMSELRDEEGPEGYAHVDLKTTHLRLDYKAQEGPQRIHSAGGEPPEAVSGGSGGSQDAGSAGAWMLSLIDLDSVMPVAAIPLRDAKYNLAAVDPEKFMPLHDSGRLVTVSPAETIYSVGLTFLSAVAQRLGLSTRRRGFKVAGLEDQGGGAARAVDAAALRETIERVRAVDELNLIKVYFANKTRRMLAGRFDQDPEGLRALLARHVDRHDVRKEALEEASSGYGYGCGYEGSCPSVHPQLFAALCECLQPRALRLPPRQIEALFAAVPPACY